jgi:chitin disaccharide deacetylase
MAEAARFILCADDYAQNGAISEAIVDLAGQGRLSATSAMTTSPFWPGEAHAIMALRDTVAVGLHLNLTHGAPLGPMTGLAPSGLFPEIGPVIAASLTRQLDAVEIRAEIDRQLDAFEDAAGAPPDHIDGHQHVHTLPTVRRALIAALVRRYPGRPILLRTPSDHQIAMAQRGTVPKALVVAALSTGFARMARKAGFLTNHGFAGFSDFSDKPYGDEFARFQRAPGKRHLVMCHPGMDGSTDDPIAARRPFEYEYLKSAEGLPDRLWHPPARGAAEPADWTTGFTNV